MNTKTKYMIPAFAAVFALTFAIATPYVMAEGNFDGHSKSGAKHHEGHQAVTIEGFTGSIPIPEDIDIESMMALQDQVSVSLTDAASAAKTAGVTDVMKASIGIVTNENGDKFVAWILGGITVEEETVTHNIFVIDAGNAENTKSVTESFDHSNIE